MTVKPITVDRINSSVTLRRDNVIHDNYGAQLGGYAPTPERVLQNKCISHSERQGDSCADLSSETCLPNTIDQCLITGDSGVTVGDIGATVGDSGVLVGDSGATVGDSGATVGDSGVTAVMVVMIVLTYSPR